MPRVNGESLQASKERVYLTLRRHPMGLKEAELAEIMELDRRTLNNYLRALETEGKIYKEGLLWLALPYDQAQLRKFELSPEEAMTLYLAARLFVKQNDKRNEPAETALMKLAAALVGDAKVGNEIHQAALELSRRPDDGAYNRIFRTIIQAYIYRRVVHITYEPATTRPFETDFEPYLLEPSAIGFTTYAIGQSSIVHDLRTYKLERIRAAALTRQEYSIPRDFPGLEVLRNAWSIIHGEDLVTVTLRFSPAVRKRVLETRWHFSEEKQDDPEKDGYLLWKAQVADTTDMLPWVKGWGSDCEVVEPKELRNALAREAQELAELYQVAAARAQKMIYYAHSRKDRDQSEWQFLLDHLTNTAGLAEKFGQDAEISELARVAALFHDMGKYSKAFQARLNGSGHIVDHATAGARTIRELFRKDQLETTLSTMLAYCIAGHHTGLPDYGDSSDVDGDGTLLARVLKKRLEDFSAFQSELDITSVVLKPRRVKTSNEGFSIAFLTRMIFSVLVDADFQDTESFACQGEKPRGGHASIEELCVTFNAAMQKFADPQNDIDRKRTETLKACMEKTDSEQGFFTLTVPTGGGKTLASMAFALNHAAKHGLKRVIYVIPFTSIIEQNAAVFKDHLGESNVLEHHSNFDWKKGDKPDAESVDYEARDVLDKLKLASENWDIPIVVTTNVQFFESLFANKSSRCRKLHNLAKSVIILDEAQILPREYLDPCMLAIKELVVNYGVSAVFCTATQPALNQRLPNTHFTELAPDPQALFNFYKRVRVTNLGRTPDAELLGKLKTHPQVLCIVNTRRHAKGLFDQLESEGNFHLSTLMCPTHRKEVLSDIRERLRTGQPCRLISTQVMEAGIDVDFAVGFRALAGLDSIIQAAGRVNREMKRGVSDMYIFDPETPFIKKTPTFIKQGAAIAESILRDFADCLDSKQAIESYFNFLYSVQGKAAFDVKHILSRFDNGLEFEFKKAADDFRMIDNNTVAIVIPYNNEAKQLLEQAKYHPYPFSFARQLQMYTVNIYENEFEKLRSKGVIETVNETYQALPEASMHKFYDENTGLVLPEESGGDAILIDI